MKFTCLIIAMIGALPSVTTLAQSPALRTGLTNPAPSKDDLFGRSVAVLGSDRVVIGASGRTSDYTNPAVYLFATSGQLLTTFTNPPGTRGGSLSLGHYLLGLRQS
jgi:hypothetical protein